MREDKPLLRRLLIVSQKRDDIDLCSLISKYEFSVVPRSLFTFDGKLILCTNKSILTQEIEKLIEKNVPISLDNGHP